MRKRLLGLVGIAAAAFSVSSASAQETIKIGVIMTFSGQFADAGTQMPTTASRST